MTDDDQLDRHTNAVQAFVRETVPAGIGFVGALVNLHTGRFAVIADGERLVVAATLRKIADTLEDGPSTAPFKLSRRATGDKS